jgi:predicted dehydrogenase
MATRRVRAGIIGTGFMGRAHLEAIQRLGTVDVVAVAGSRIEKARSFADAAGIDRAEADYRMLLADNTIDVVHVCTPNASHYAMASAAIDAGKHVMCEKPLAVTSAEAASLSAAAAARGVRHATCYNLRFYPMVQQMRCMRQAGEFGDILVAQGTYSQDWLLYDTDWNWRVEARVSGPLRAMADIGSHWCDMLEHVSGERIAARGSRDIPHVAQQRDRRHRRLWRGSLPSRDPRARIVHGQPGGRRVQEPVVGRNLRHTRIGGLEPGAAGRAVDRPPQRP